MVFLFNLANIFNDLSYIIIPVEDADAYTSLADTKRSLLANVPMGIISIVGMILATRKGISEYRDIA